MGVASDEEGPTDPALVAIVADRLRDGAHVRLVEGAAQRRSAVTAAAEDHSLRAVGDVWGSRVIGGANRIVIEERVRRGQLARERMEGHLITVTRNGPAAWRCSASASRT